MTFKKGHKPVAGKRKSYKAAVEAKCKDCIYDPLDVGTWRQQVSLCTSEGCPLCPVRPVSEVRKNG